MAWRQSSKSSKRHTAQTHEQGHSLLSLSGLAWQHGAWDSNRDNCTQSRTPRTGRAAGTASSVTCSVRDDTQQLQEVISSHEQLIAALSEKVLSLEDSVERLQAEIAPAVKLVAAMREAHARQQQTAGADVEQQVPPAAHGKDSTTACTADAAVDTTTVADTDTNRAGQATQQAPQHAATAAISWLDPFHSLKDGAQAANAILSDLGNWAGGYTPRGLAGRDQQQPVAESTRDDCGSVRSFCTSISYGSTQVSAPAYMTDLRPAAKAPSRAPQQYLQERSSLQLGWDAGRHGLAGAAAAAAGGGQGCSSWPLAVMDLEEECSPEELQQMIELVVGQQQQQQQRQQEEDAVPAAAGASTDSSNSTEEQQEKLYGAISCLAVHAERDEEVRQQLCTPVLLQRATAMLQEAHLGCCQAAAHLIWYISRSDTLREHLLQQQEQLLPALLALLAVQDAAAARAAAFALNNLALEQSCRHAMVEAGAVAGLVDMLSGCDALGQEAAAAALMMLASEEGSIRARIVACNGVQALVAVLKYGGPAAQEAAAAALENLSLDADCELALASEGAVEGLLAVLKDGTTGTQAAAAGALRNLAVNEQLEGHLLAAGTVPVLVALVSSPHEDAGVRTAALEGLRNLAASSTSSGDALVQAGGAAALVDAARSLPAATARSAALGALLVLSMDENHRRAVMGAGAGGVLVHAALSGSSLAKEYAARALANLATNEANRLELLKEGAATVLAFLLKSQLAQVKAPAAAAAGEGQQGAVAAAAAGSASAGLCLAATRALQNLSKCKPGCKALLDAGCIPPLVSALAVPGLVATAAASALCSICISTRGLQELVNCGGCSELVAAVAKPKHVTPRGKRQGLRLLRRLSKGPGRAAVQEQVAALGLQLV